MVKGFALIAALFVVVALPAAAQDAAEWNKVVEAAKKEGKLQFYTSGVGSPYHKEVGKLFEKKYGIRFESLEARASELRERIRTEQTAGRFLGDVHHNGGTITWLMMTKDGAFQPHGGLPNIKNILPAFKADDIRVAIARAMVFEPAVLLLDEPLSNLDAKLRVQMGEEFRALQKRVGITTLYVTHDQEEAMALSDRVVVMQHGNILQVGAPEEIYQRPASRAVAEFFGSPNLLEARVTACADESGGKFRLDVEGPGWKGQCLAGESFAPGETALMMVRPEDFTLAAASAVAAQGWVAWPGRIADRVFHGARRTYRVESGALAFTAEAPASTTLAVGDQVTLMAATAGTWAVRP